MVVDPRKGAGEVIFTALDMGRKMPAPGTEVEKYRTLESQGSHVSYSNPYNRSTPL